MTSRIPEFYKLSIAERQHAVASVAGLTEDQLAHLADGGLSLGAADKFVENVIGVYGLPLGIATNFRINGRDVLVPMVVEEPSVIAGCSHAARLAREGGGFAADVDPPVMIGQLQVMDLESVDAAAAAVETAAGEIGRLVDAQSPTIAHLGGGFRGLETHTFHATPAGAMLVVHLLIDVRDAMGANAVNTAAEAVAPLIESLTGGRVVLRILSNLADRRLARARCRIPASALDSEALPGADVAARVVEAQILAQVDPYRAATHNKGVMNGIDAVLIATGNDWRAAEAGAHAYAARAGQYTALTRWEQADDGDLVGEIELPLAVGIVGGTTRAHPLAALALRILGANTASDLAATAAAVGLAQNLGALRALAAEGIQAGHMALHARQLAVTAGATGGQIDVIATQLVDEGNVRLARARQLLKDANTRQGGV
jgi:hydroxymethylglutaryl-CoA reductase